MHHSPCSPHLALLLCLIVMVQRLIHSLMVLNASDLVEASLADLLSVEGGSAGQTDGI